MQFVFFSVFSVKMMVGAVGRWGLLVRARTARCDSVWDMGGGGSRYQRVPPPPFFRGLSYQRSSMNTACVLIK